MSAPDHRTAGPSPALDGIPNLSPADLRRHIRSLLSPDLTIRQTAARHLADQGISAAREIIRTILTPSFPRRAVTLCSTILEHIGKPSLPAFIEALEGLSDPATPAEAQRFGSVILSLDPVADRRAVPCLMRQLGRVNRLLSSSDDPAMQASLDSTRVAIHTILSQLGDRSGANDLLDLLGDGRRRVRDGVVQSLSLVGDRRSLPPLARLHDIETGVSSSSAHMIRGTIRGISRRERVKPNDPLFQELSTDEKEALDQILSGKQLASQV